MKRKALALVLGAAALATGAVAFAEAEDALLRRYPYDPACAWGRIGNGKGMVVRCMSEDEAKELRTLAPSPATPSPATGPSSVSPASATKPGAATTPASTTKAIAGGSAVSSTASSAEAAPSTTAEEPDATPAPEPALDAFEVSVGPVTADEGSLGVGKLGAPKDRYTACVQKNGGLKDKTGEVSVRFLVRGKGIAEGVSVAKRSNVSKEAAECVAEVVDRRRVGAPPAQLVGATVVIKFTKK